MLNEFFKLVSPVLLSMIGDSGIVDRPRMTLVVGGAPRHTKKFSIGTLQRAQQKVGRNDQCPCGSGGKHKHCCG